MAGIKKKETLYYRDIDSPLGTFRLIADEKCLRFAGFHDGEQNFIPAGFELVGKNTPLLTWAGSEFAAYFRGGLKVFQIPYSFSGTSFQEKVWCEMAGIPYGERISYGELAKRTGSPRACRAVGQASNRNPLAVIVPCHRVVGHDGRLVGYGAGIARKAWLLELEQKH
ncbi:MAG: methylated-DNA--[protein]-cysteine S-methyltransferase [Peptococcaceae bacterium]|nr:methylated-DNA--[protein]-cysteine S-methyltransferase [Peptococcaceae bacterium]MDH7524187.1 methylated-DNA--[protein]-cysteine S-methyltransferase [Peptococcaceae bacterium]